MNLSEKIPSDLKSIPKCIDAVIKQARRLPFEEEQIHDIRLSLEEALANAIKHGNRLNPDLCVTVSAEAADNFLSITVKDQGEGFDFQNTPDPTKPDNLQKLSGRGIFLIRNRMDKVVFFDGGRGIKMTKLFQKGVKK